MKSPPASAGDARDMGSVPGSGRPLEEEMATPPLSLPGRLQPTGPQRVRHDRARRTGQWGAAIAHTEPSVALRDSLSQGRAGGKRQEGDSIGRGCIYTRIYVYVCVCIYIYIYI